MMVSQNSFVQHINPVVVAFVCLLLVSISCNTMEAGNNDRMVLTEEFIFKDAPFPSCHASTIEETSRGLVAAWFGGTHESHDDVEIWVSRRVGGAWTDPVSVADGIQDQDKRYPCWNPVLYQVPGGELLLFYKVGPNPREWWGMMKSSVDNGISWSDATKLPDGFLGPVKNKPVLVDNNILICPSSTEHDGWRVHFEITEDFGKTWRKAGPIDPDRNFEIIQPSILFHEKGRLQMLARSRNNYVISSWSDDNGNSWSSPEPTFLPNPNSGTDAVTLQNGLQLIVYNHSYRDYTRSWGGGRSALTVAVSKDGREWETVHVLENEPGEYSYPAVIQGDDGVVHITYTWNREKIKYVSMNPAKLDHERISGIIPRDGQVKHLKVYL
jgi:predicted neuraminidase